MTKYEMIAEALQEKVNNGELTLEDANKINDLAYEKYYGSVVEEASNENKDLELIDELRALVEAGKVKLEKDDIKCIKKLIKNAEGEEESTPAEEDGEKETEKKDETSENDESKEEEPAPAE